MPEPLVLVTRPEPGCSALATLLEAEGLAALKLPAFRFEALVPTPTLVEAWQMAQRRLVVFTSPRAVSFGLQAVASEKLAGASIAAVGPATARLLAQRGFQPLQPAEGGFTSEALLEHPALQRQSTATESAALVLAAPGGRRLLREELAERGWRTELLEVYRRINLEPDAHAGERLAAAQTVISLWTSAVAMEQLLSALSGKARKQVLEGEFVVISRRLEARARELGALHVRRAAGPDNESLAHCALEAAGGV